ncbi:hypothetical protein GF337_04735 [candidate division KSB1 bacterium]|nr:hypothetical protein [candidate division KSB1 bacterium]
MVYLIYSSRKYTFLLILASFLLAMTCKDPEIEKKIDPNLKSELIKLKKADQLDQNITILFKVNEQLTEVHHIMLEKNNVEISANIGNIYTAVIPANSIYDFAKMRFVDYIQGQKRLKTQLDDESK